MHELSVPVDLTIVCQQHEATAVQTQTQTQSRSRRSAVAEHAPSQLVRASVWRACIQCLIALRPSKRVFKPRPHPTNPVCAPGPLVRSFQRCCSRSFQPTKVLRTNGLHDTRATTSTVDERWCVHDQAAATSKL
jgi:hypothetical protein